MAEQTRHELNDHGGTDSLVLSIRDSDEIAGLKKGQDFRWTVAGSTYLADAMVESANFLRVSGGISRCLCLHVISVVSKGRWGPAMTILTCIIW